MTNEDMENDAKFDRAYEEHLSYEQEENPTGKMNEVLNKLLEASVKMIDGLANKPANCELELEKFKSEYAKELTKCMEAHKEDMQKQKKKDTIADFALASIWQFIPALTTSKQGHHGEYSNIDDINSVIRAGANGAVKFCRATFKIAVAFDFSERMEYLTIKEKPYIRVHQTIKATTCPLEGDFNICSATQTFEHDFPLSSHEIQAKDGNWEYIKKMTGARTFFSRRAKLERFTLSGLGESCPIEESSSEGLVTAKTEKTKSDLKGALD